MRRPLAIAFVLLMLPTIASAARKPKEKYFVRVVGVEATTKIPAGLDERARELLGKLIADRPDFVTTLAGAPDPDADPAGFTKYVRKKKVRAFNVVIKLTSLELEALPPAEGKTGQILKAHVGLSLLGTGLPDKTMALAGDGSATVKLEIGARVRPRDEQNAYGDALEGALRSALDDAARKLAAGPPSLPSKR